MPFLTARRNRFLVGAGAALWAAGVCLWVGGGLDKAFQIAHNGMRENPVAAETAVLISSFGMSFAILVFLAFLAGTPAAEASSAIRRVALVVLLSFAISGAVGDLIKQVLVRPRPFIEYAGEITPVIRPDSWSMPSGHSTKIFALVLPMLLLVPARRKRRKAVKVLLLLTACGVAYSRIVLGVHYPGDVLAGIGTAFILLPVAASLADWIYELGARKSGAADRTSQVAMIILFALAFYLATTS
jgi:membrane-associated phospholipid phosphatase